MSGVTVKKPRVELTHEEKMKRDRRMATAIIHGITADDFGERFKCDPRREIPRICEAFKIKSKQGRRVYP